LLLFTVFYWLEAEDVAKGTDCSGSLTLPRETSFFSFWLLYAATPAMAA
jgi:hypothetical protein